MSRWLHPWLAATPLVFAIDRVRHLVEGSMPLHMLLQFPLLALAGAGAARVLEQVWPHGARGWRAVDGDGLVAVLLIIATSALWMVPAALDAAVLEPPVAATKYLGWWAAGAALALSAPKLRAPMRLFLGGNLAWMLATAGLLYVEAEQRLCVSYRYDEQAWAGWGLCLAAIGVLVHLVVQRPRFFPAAKH